MSEHRCDQAMALAGLFQAVRLVQQTANGEHRNEADIDTCLNSILDLQPKSIESVFGNGSNLRTGLEVLINQLDNSRMRDMELTKYVILMLHLERKLSRKKDLLEIIRTGVERVTDQAGFFDSRHPSVIASLADIYKQTVSTLQPRIMVNGEPGILTNPDSKNMIRALLLAGIRAAVLWRQCGANRLTLIFRRKTLLACGRQLLEDSHATD